MAICPPDHAHDEKTTCRFTHGCDCLPCQFAGELYRRDLRKAHTAMREHRTGMRRIDAGATVAHLRRLRMIGVGWRRIAALSGRSESWLMKVWRGMPTVLEAHERSVLSVPLSTSSASQGNLLPARGASRRLQALVARGHSSAMLAGRLNMTRTNMHPLLHGTQKRATKRRIAAVHRLYAELWDQPPVQITREQKSGVSRALRQAREHGWVPPYAWDDIDRDSAPQTALEITA